MDDYQLGVIKFNNNQASLKMMSAINDMEMDRLAAWTAYFKKDYECELLREQVNRLQTIADKLGIKSQKHIIKKMDGRKRG